MDRNQDGDVSWLDARHVFEELDTDNDGLIHFTEVEKVGIQIQKSRDQKSEVRQKTEKP